MEQGWLVCEEGRVRDVYSVLPEELKGIPVEDMGDRLIIPGLTDLHIHAPQYTFRSLGMDMELLEWLETNTLPGEAGCEALTLELADQWGADVIRDSDGTRLSDEIVNAGYGIYSTICIIRDHNEWARAHMDRLQQTFLMSAPKTAKADTVIIGLLDGYFKEQLLKGMEQKGIVVVEGKGRGTKYILK